ncbi:MAG: YqeG family HAD IIIA-type phosphatase [Oscillospiraceae bacterium]|jgi:HAD superfamily phosphatase (TIGR01668 family)|nr:YqeG family HAD IIIA-type phosphatase [Oscillospiraceae bacterium]
MSFSPVPAYSFEALTDIPADFLRSIGVTFLMLDLDNTIAPYSSDKPDDGVLRWADALRAGGISLFIVSNSRKRGRAERFAESLRVGYINAARKPSPAGVLAAIRNCGAAPGSSALVGDQIYTDTLAANRAGVTSILVKPIRLSNAFLAARYGLEAPFRALGARQSH